MNPIDAAWDILKSKLQQPFRGIAHSMRGNAPEEVLREAGKRDMDLSSDEAEQISADFMSRKLSDVALRNALESFAPENYFYQVDPEGARLNDIDDEEGNIFRHPSGYPFIHSQRKRRATNYDIGANPDSKYPTDTEQDSKLLEEEYADLGDPTFRYMHSLTPAPMSGGNRDQGMMLTYPTTYRSNLFHA